MWLTEQCLAFPCLVRMSDYARVYCHVWYSTSMDIKRVIILQLEILQNGDNPYYFKHSVGLKVLICSWPVPELSSLCTMTQEAECCSPAISQPSAHQWKPFMVIQFWAACCQKYPMSCTCVHVWAVRVLQCLPALSQCFPSNSSSSSSRRRPAVATLYTLATSVHVLQITHNSYAAYSARLPRLSRVT